MCAISGTHRRQLRSRQTFTAAVLLVLSAAYAMSQSLSSRQVEEIIELEHRRATAVVHRDTEFLDKITAPDSVRILPTGTLESKSQLLSDLRSGAVTYTSINVDQLSIKLFSQTAVATGRSAFRGERGGKPFQGRCRFSRVWMKRQGTWQEVLFQLTPIP